MVVWTCLYWTYNENLYSFSENKKIYPYIYVPIQPDHFNVYVSSHKFLVFTPKVDFTLILLPSLLEKVNCLHSSYGLLHSHYTRYSNVINSFLGVDLEYRNCELGPYNLEQV